MVTDAEDCVSARAGTTMSPQPPSQFHVTPRFWLRTQVHEDEIPRLVPYRTQRDRHLTDVVQSSHQQREHARHKDNHSRNRRYFPVKTQAEQQACDQRAHQRQERKQESTPNHLRPLFNGLNLRSVCLRFL